MNEPIFKPSQWVLYELAEGVAGFGQIVGGLYTAARWTYQVKGATPNDNNVEVPEDSIKSVMENGNWTVPHHFSGSNSAYADTTETN